ncbi:hypothetical protein ACSHWB_26425 [Lentzea sp. HUAS TT2]|uniref:hypothetical protein n=1 Tax=Lentzea sp. HUAS TT2 TaxID=3447454 RepID=UPI003F700378
MVHQDDNRVDRAQRARARGGDVLGLVASFGEVLHLIDRVALVVFVIDGVGTIEHRII